MMMPLFGIKLLASNLGSRDCVPREFCLAIVFFLKNVFSVATHGLKTPIIFTHFLLTYGDQNVHAICKS
jgi:hypothetical protein